MQHWIPGLSASVTLERSSWNTKSIICTQSPSFWIQNLSFWIQNSSVLHKIHHFEYKIHFFEYKIHHLSGYLGRSSWRVDPRAGRTGRNETCGAYRARNPRSAAGIRTCPIRRAPHLARREFIMFNANFLVLNAQFLVFKCKAPRF